MRKIISLVGCLCLCMGMSAQVRNYITLWGDMGEASLLTDIESVSMGASMGVGGGIGVGYELYANHFLFTVGVGGNVSHSVFNMLPFSSTLPNQIDSEGDRFDYVYTLNNRQDAYTNASLQVPLMVGAQLDRFYFLVGAKLDMSFLVNTDVSATISSQGVYPQFIDPFTGMPEHMFFDDYALEYTDVVDFNANVMVSAELGWRLGSVYHGTGFDVPKSKTVYRLGFFADYGLLDLHRKGTADLVSLPTKFDSQDMKSNIGLNDILSSNQATKAVNNLMVGVKFTVLFQLPEAKNCVLCKDDLPLLRK